MLQRREQVRQPATGVVVMPIRKMAVNIGPKHCAGLITDPGMDCQTPTSSQGPQLVFAVALPQTSIELVQGSRIWFV